MSIFDVDENIEALKPVREVKFKSLFEMTDQEIERCDDMVKWFKGCN